MSHTEDVRVAASAQSGNALSMITTRDLIDWYDTVLEAAVRDGRKKPATRNWYQFQLKKLAAVAGDVLACDLRPLHLLRVRSTNHFARAVRTLFAWALDNDLVLKNPFLKLEVPKCGQRERVIERTEMAALYVAARRDFRRYLFLLRHTIARPGEIRLLRWDQVDTEARVLRLRDFKSKDKRRDGATCRVIPLDGPAVVLLSGMKRRATGGEYVFGGAKPWPYNTVRAYMRSTRKRAGLEGDGERIVCYTLRHTSATNATRAGVPLAVLAAMMGHTKVTTTQRYQHLDTDDLLTGIDRLSGYRPPVKK